MGEGTFVEYFFKLTSIRDKFWSNVLDTDECCIFFSVFRPNYPP
jgi:hypothetical protein